MGLNTGATAAPAAALLTAGAGAPIVNRGGPAPIPLCRKGVVIEAGDEAGDLAAPRTGTEALAERTAGASFCPSPTAGAEPALTLVSGAADAGTGGGPTDVTAGLTTGAADGLGETSGVTIGTAAAMGEGEAWGGWFCAAAAGRAEAIGAGAAMLVVEPAGGASSTTDTAAEGAARGTGSAWAVAGEGGGERPGAAAA